VSLTIRVLVPLSRRCLLSLLVASLSAARVPKGTSIQVQHVQHTVQETTTSTALFVRSHSNESIRFDKRAPFCGRSIRIAGDASVMRNHNVALVTAYDMDSRTRCTCQHLTL
jgi:hypothetical protein